MVKIIGNYRWFDGASFDHRYYQQEHMRLTRELLQPLGLQRLESDHTLSATPLKAGQVVASSNAYFESLPAAQAALAQTVAQNAMNALVLYKSRRSADFVARSQALSAATTGQAQPHPGCTQQKHQRQE